MEPMTLGSPGGSPAANSSYLPSFLMGEPQTQINPHNTLSPKSSGRNLSFGANSPTSPPDYNRSILGHKTLFGGQQQTPMPGNESGMGGAYPNTPLQSHNVGHSGPPTQGLFDSLRSERNQVQTPTRSVLQTQASFGTPIAQNVSVYGTGQSNFQQSSAGIQASFNESYLNSPPFSSSMPRGGLMSPLGPSTTHMIQYPLAQRYTDFWVTVYGFPPSASSTILQHFAQCGTIVDKVFPPQNGNWVHLQFSSTLECDKALNYNEKILSNNIMIGVTQCKDKNIIDKENYSENNTPQLTKVRPLAQTAYKSVQNDSAVVASPSAPQKSTGLMNRAMDLFFGW